jgi:DNA-binding XRE family transcriptional regulator
MMQDKIDSLCEMAKKVGVSDKTIEMIKADLSKDMEG